MNKVVPLLTSGMSPAFQTAAHRLDAAVIAAIEEAKAAALPQGLIVALLHAHAQQQTLHLIEAN